MHSTTGAISVTAESLANDLTEQLLQPRRLYLKHRAPRSKYVHDLRRKMAALMVKPFAMLLAVSLADLDDGVPLSLVLQPYETIIALLRGHVSGVRIHHASGDFLTLVQREARLESAKRAAENDLLAHPESAAAQEAVLQAEARCEAEQDRLVAALRERRAESVLSLAGA